MNTILKIIQRFYSRVLVALLALIYLGCFTTGDRPPIYRGDKGLPHSHVWGFLTNMDAETSGYGMYTYVLFGRRVDVSGGVQTQTLERYKGLLEAIAASTPADKEKSELPESELNIFYIPSVAEGKGLSLANYKSDLALRYLALSSRMIKSQQPELAKRLSTRPGPFLISTLKPIGEIDTEQTNLLYADLSTTNPAALDEVVATYKQRVSREGISDVEPFQPFRLTLLNLILDADDNVKLVKAALAEWKQ